jgi:hypothetical protein
MNSVQTKTIKVKVHSCLVTELCEEYRIPFIVCKIVIKKCLKTGKDIKKPEGIPEGWQKWTYDECLEHNANIKFQPTHINVLLRSSPFMVIDFDSKEDIPSYLHLFGDDWKSKSSARGLPHLWRLKKENDFSKCAVAIQIDGKKTHIDLKYFNIFERIDSKIEYTNTDIQTFDFETYHNKPIIEKHVPQEQKPPSNNYNLIMGDYSTSRIMKHLGNCNEEYISTYSDWFKIGRAIKNVFQTVQGDENNLPIWLEILVSWSRLSKQHADEDYDAWEKTFEGDSKCGLTTIINYSLKSNHEKYNEIEQEYYKLKREDPEHTLLKGICYIKLLETVKVYDTEQQKIRDEFPNYDMVKEEFEINHCKIVEKALFIKHTIQDVIFFTEPKIKTAYKHLKYTDYSTNPPSKHEFISKWLSDEYVLRYNNVGVYPPPLICPKDIFNLWKPFYIETFTGDYERDEEGLQMFIKHVKILCGNDEEVAMYITQWLGQMFQFPAVKTIVPTFISKPGAGKGTLIEFLSDMMGSRKILITAEPSKTVWGNFNGQMSGSFFVNLNEMSIKETTDAEGVIKTLITDPTMNINLKGIDSYTIKSFHRFIITTNNQDPIKVEKGDRRNVVIRSSDEKIGDTNYFNILRERLKQVNTMRTIYDALMALPDLENFGSIKRPETEHQAEMKEKSRDIFDSWIEYLTRFNADQKEMKFLGTTQYDLFKKWCVHNNPKYETNPVKMGIAIKRLGIDGIQSGIRGKLGSYTIYDIQKLKLHYKTDVIDQTIGEEEEIECN